MKKTNNNTSIKVIFINPPTREQAAARTQELSKYLEKISENPHSTI